MNVNRQQVSAGQIEQLDLFAEHLPALGRGSSPRSAQEGVCVRREEGTPQGGSLSPLLANLLLDDLDKELERRGHRFCRYADDCNIHVYSRKAGERVLASATRFLERKLKQCKRAVGIARFLMSRGIERNEAWRLGGSGKEWWRMSLSPQAHRAMAKKWFKELGLEGFADRCLKLELFT